MTAVAALAVALFWTLGSGWLMRLARIDVRTLSQGLSMQFLGNWVVASLGIWFLAGTDGSLAHFSGLPEGRDAAAALLGLIVSTPGSALLAGVVRRQIAPMEWQIRQIPPAKKLATLALVPLTEEIIWRGVAVGALVALGTPFAVSVAFSAVLGVAAHHKAFSLQGLLKGVAPSAVGIALAYYLSRNLWVAVFVHLAVDLEILLPIQAPDPYENDGVS